jgi:hypothetical protein
MQRVVDALRRVPAWLVWTLTVVLFAGGIAWMLAAHSTVSYWCAPILGAPLIVALGWFDRGRPPEWVLWVIAGGLWLGGSIWIIAATDQLSYWVGGALMAPLFVLATATLERARDRSPESGSPDGIWELPGDGGY